MTHVSISLPAKLLASVSIAQSHEETRYYLCGVYIEHLDTGIIITATDGHVLFSGFADHGETKPAFFKPFIFNVDGVLTKALKSSKASSVTLEWSTDATEVLYSVFGVSGLLAKGFSRIIDGHYPNWRRVVNHDFSARHPKGNFSCALIKRVCEAATLYSGNKDSIFEVVSSDTDGQGPHAIVFDDCPENGQMAGVIMPTRGYLNPTTPHWFRCDSEALGYPVSDAA